MKGPDIADDFELKMLQQQVPEIFDFKTWSYKWEIPFFSKENWHQIKDHGLVYGKMVL